MNDKFSVKNEWRQFIDGFHEDTPILEILSACIDTFGDGGCGLSFFNWGEIVRDHVERKQSRTKSLQQPTSLVKDPPLIYHLKPEKMEFSRIFSMKCSNRDGYKAPHKAIYLLSIIDCINLGYITERRFNIDSVILDRFDILWKRYVKVTCFSPSIWNPIFFMEDNIIHKEWNDGFYGVQPRTLKRCKVIFKYFEIASDLWDALQDRGRLDSIKSKLIESYIQGNVCAPPSQYSISIAETGNYWVIPGNINIFRVTDYFDKYDIVDWKQSHYKFEVGDIVFIYVSKPICSIRYMLQVVKCDVSFEEYINDEDYWGDKHEFRANVEHYKYVRLKLQKSSTSEDLHLDNLAKYGMSVPQGAIKNLSPELINYILKHF